MTSLAERVAFANRHYESGYKQGIAEGERRMRERGVEVAIERYDSEGILHYIKPIPENTNWRESGRYLLIGPLEDEE